jgi:DNA-binding IclR family transcriptional regulator
LYRLAMDTGLAANVAVLEAHRVIILDRVEGPAFVKAAIEESGNIRTRSPGIRGIRSVYSDGESRDVGGQLPVESTALGKTFLAHIPDEEFAEFIAATKLQENDSNWKALQSELTTIRRSGYCMMDFEPHNESCSLAAPILDATNAIRAAVSVSCRRHLTIWNDRNALSGIVKEAAWEISCRLDHSRGLRRRPEDTRSAQDGVSDLHLRRVRYEVRSRET